MVGQAGQAEQWQQDASAVVCLYERLKAQGSRPQVQSEARSHGTAWPSQV